MDLGERPGPPSLRNLERGAAAQEYCAGRIGGSWERRGRGGGVDWDLHEAGRSLRNAPGLSRGESQRKGRAAGPGEAARRGGPGPVGRRSPELGAAGERLPRLLSSGAGVRFGVRRRRFCFLRRRRRPAAAPAMAAAGARRSPGPSSGLRGRLRLGFQPPPPLLLVLLLAGAAAAASREPDSPCRLKTVTVSTLPALRESDIGWSGTRAGAGAGAAAAAAASPGSAGSAGTAAESRLLLFVRNELPGRVAVQDDLDNTELPFFTLGKAWRRGSRGPGSPK